MPLSLPIVVYGSGGHGVVVADAALAAGFEVRGFLDDAVAVGTRVLDLPVLGSSSWLDRDEQVAVAFGFGSNEGRSRLFAALEQRGVPIATVIHPSAVVSPFARVGQGTAVLALAVVNPLAEIGCGAIINSGAIVEHHVVVGDFAHVSPNATVAGSARVGRLAHLGAGATILPGRCIGDGSVVGAGAVVVRDIPVNVTASGVPARVHSTPVD